MPESSNAPSPAWKNCGPLPAATSIPFPTLSIGRPINRHTGSLARTPAGDLALMRDDPAFISRRQLEDGLERIWSRGGWLSLAVKKPIPHESFAQRCV